MCPYSPDELKKKSLHDIIADVDKHHQPLTYLYPTRHPKSAFRLKNEGNQENVQKFLCLMFA